MVYNLLILFIFLSTIYIGLSIINIIYNYVLQFNFWRKNKVVYYDHDDESTPDVIPEPVSYTGYDVNDFKSRMAAYKKEYHDGVPLYDLPDPPVAKHDFTGVEVITPEYETFMDKRLK